MVVVAVDPFYAEALGMPLALTLSYLILLQRKYIGVEIEDNGRDVMTEQPLDDGRGTRCAARMQHHPVDIVGNDDGRLVLAQQSQRYLKKRYTDLTSGKRMILRPLRAPRCRLPSTEK